MLGECVNGYIPVTAAISVLYSDFLQVFWASDPKCRSDPDET